MISLRSRPIAEVLSVVILAGCIFLLFGLSADSAGLDRSSRLNLVVTAVFAFNIPILLSWMAFGVAGGIVFSVFSAVAVIFFDLRTGLYGYHILILPFFVTSYIGYRLLLLREGSGQSYRMRLEDADEEINVLTNNLNERNEDIRSMDDRLVRYSLLKGVSESLSTVLSREEVDRLIVEEASATIGKEGRTILYLVDTNTQELMLAAMKGAPGVRAKKGDPFDRWVLRNRRSLIIEDVVKDFRFHAEDIQESRGIFRSMIAQPLIIESKVIGILRMDSAGESGYTQDDLRLLDIISDLGAVAVQNSYLYSKTQELAIRDGLTGLAVRRYFMERFRHELRRSARKREGLSILMLDIDHFKDYNDKYGHTAGDLVLKYMAKTLAEMADDADVVGRYGGEEMVVLLCGKSKRDAVREAEKIRAALKEQPIVLRRQKTELTVSLGVATYPEDAATEEELIRIADARLYKAKTGGRDRVCSD